MAGIGDLLKLTATTAPGAAGGLNGGMLASVQAAGSLLERLVRGIERLVEIEAPSESNVIFKDETGLVVPPPGGQFTASFVSRWVDVSMPAAAPFPIDVRFLDTNNQTQAFHDSLRIFPGDFRSFSIHSKGVLVSPVGGGSIWFITYWS